MFTINSKFIWSFSSLFLPGHIIMNMKINNLASYGIDDEEENQKMMWIWIICVERTANRIIERFLRLRWINDSTDEWLSHKLRLRSHAWLHCWNVDPKTDECGDINSISERKSNYQITFLWNHKTFSAIIFNTLIRNDRWIDLFVEG